MVTMVIKLNQQNFNHDLPQLGPYA